MAVTKVSIGNHGHQTNFGNNIKHYREKKGLTQQQLADIVGGIEGHIFLMWDVASVILHYNDVTF